MELYPAVLYCDMNSSRAAVQTMPTIKPNEPRADSREARLANDHFIAPPDRIWITRLKADFRLAIVSLFAFCGVLILCRLPCSGSWSGTG